jgi:hypothetical protein
MKKFLLASALLITSVSAMAASSVAPNFKVGTNDDLRTQPDYGHVFISSPYARISGVCKLDKKDYGRYKCAGNLTATTAGESADGWIAVGSSITGDRCHIAFHYDGNTKSVTYVPSSSHCTGEGKWYLGNRQTGAGPDVSISQDQQ